MDLPPDLQGAVLALLPARDLMVLSTVSRDCRAACAPELARLRAPEPGRFAETVALGQDVGAALRRCPPGMAVRLAAGEHRPESDPFKGVLASRVFADSRVASGTSLILASTSTSGLSLTGNHLLSGLHSFTEVAAQPNSTIVLRGGRLLSKNERSTGSLTALGPDTVCSMTGCTACNLNAANGSIITAVGLQFAGHLCVAATATAKISVKGGSAESMFVIARHCSIVETDIASFGSRSSVDASSEVRVGGHVITGSERIERDVGCPCRACDRQFWLERACVRLLFPPRKTTPWWKWGAVGLAWVLSPFVCAVILASSAVVILVTVPVFTVMFGVEAVLMPRPL